MEKLNKAVLNNSIEQVVLQKPNTTSKPKLRKTNTETRMIKETPANKGYVRRRTLK